MYDQEERTRITLIYLEPYAKGTINLAATESYIYQQIGHLNVYSTLEALRNQIESGRIFDKNTLLNVYREFLKYGPDSYSDRKQPTKELNRILADAILEIPKIGESPKEFSDLVRSAIAAGVLSQVKYYIKAGPYDYVEFESQEKKDEAIRVLGLTLNEKHEITNRQYNEIILTDSQLEILVTAIGSTSLHKTLIPSAMLKLEDLIVNLHNQTGRMQEEVERIGRR